MMVFRLFSYDTGKPAGGCGSRPAMITALVLALGGASDVRSQESVSQRPQHIIGATAKITEVSTGISFVARVDTGAKSCSLHIEEMEIKDESPKRVENIGKKVRFLIRGADGRAEWIETTIAAAVRVKSSALKVGEVDRRYKVLLTLRWKDFEKEVLVTLNDRTDMEYPVLIGRNYLRGDFLVDVAKTDE